MPFPDDISEKKDYHLIFVLAMAKLEKIILKILVQLMLQENRYEIRPR